MFKRGDRVVCREAMWFGEATIIGWELMGYARIQDDEGFTIRAFEDTLEHVA